jgi:hypothetical protein
MLSPLHGFQERTATEQRESILERRFTMKTNRIRILGLAAIGLLAAVAFPSLAAAQGIPAVAGKFTLSSEVRWQGEVLPAGDYSFTMQSAAVPTEILLRGPNGAHFILSGSRSEDLTTQQSSLTIVRRGDSSYVREISLAPVGARFTYGVPKIPKGQLLAQGPATTQRVLISTSGK